MILVAVLTPLVSVGLLALLFLLPPTFQMGIIIALTIGFVSWAVSYSNHRGRLLGRELTATDDAELLETVDRLCAIADIARPEVRLVSQRQPNSWVVHCPAWCRVCTSRPACRICSAPTSCAR